LQKNRMLCLFFGKIIQLFEKLSKSMH